MMRGRGRGKKRYNDGNQAGGMFKRLRVSEPADSLYMGAQIPVAPTHSVEVPRASMSAAPIPEVAMDL